MPDGEAGSFHSRGAGLTMSRLARFVAGPTASRVEADGPAAAADGPAAAGPAPSSGMQRGGACDGANAARSLCRYADRPRLLDRVSGACACVHIARTLQVPPRRLLAC